MWQKSGTHGAGDYDPHFCAPDRDRHGRIRLRSDHQRADGLFAPLPGYGRFHDMHEVKGDLKGLKLTYVGDGNNVAHSLMFAGARLGVNVTIVCPLVSSRM